MTVIVCQDCNEVLEYADGEKVEVLYGKCSDCRTPAQEVESLKTVF